MWAEWIAAVLASGGVMVRWFDEVSTVPGDPDVQTQTVVVLSEAYLAMHDSPSAVHLDLLISVTDTRMPAELAEVPIIYLGPLAREQAVARLTERFGGWRSPESDSAIQASLSRRRPAADPQLPGPKRQLHRAGKGSEEATRGIAVPWPHGRAPADHPGSRRSRKNAAGDGVRASLQGRLRHHLVDELRSIAVRRRIARRPRRQLRDVFNAGVPQEGGGPSSSSKCCDTSATGQTASAGSSSTTTPKTSATIRRLMPTGEVTS